MAGQSKCVASQYVIKIKPNSYAHQYDVEEILFSPAKSGQKPRNLIKGGDANQKARCRYILGNFQPLASIVYAYDGRANLWTAKALNNNDIRNIHFPMTDFLRGALGDGEISITLKYVKTINLSDFGPYLENRVDVTEDRTLRNVLEMILSQHAINEGTYASSGPGQLYETTEHPFMQGFVIRDGCSKGVHIVKGANGKPQAVVAVSNSKKVFYPSGKRLVEVLQETRMKPELAAKIFEGVKLQLRYNLGRTITFGKFSDKPIREITFEHGGQMVNLVEYMEQEYDIRLELGHRVGVMAPQGDAVFPLEEMIIVPDQAVSDAKMPPEVREESLRINRMYPDRRHDAINTQLHQLQLNNPITEGFGISVEQTMLRGDFTRLNRVTVIAKNNAHLVANDMGIFRFDRNLYLSPGKVDRLIVLSSQRDAADSMACAQAVIRECRRKGTVLPSPTHVPFDTNRATMDAWVNVLRDYVEKEKKTLAFVVDSVKEYHAMIKLAEAITGVPTQHIMWKTAKQGKPQTLENIAHKVNLKVGGLNHKVAFTGPLDLNKNNILVIGLDVCHPTNAAAARNDEPSFVGITGNYLKDPCAFAGTFFAQKGRQESVDPQRLRAYTKEMLQLAASHGRKIDIIVLTRDGVSEGQYAMALNEELHAIRQGANDYNSERKVSLLGIIVTKTGNVRHFNDSNGRPDSLPPRSVVSFGTRANFTQFYMVPHRAIQGTAKAVMVTAIKNELAISEGQMQDFLLALTSLHQVVCSPVSLPEPIYQCDKLAQRGQLQFRCFRQHFPNRMPLVDGRIDFHALTNLISFNGGRLPSIRYTA